MAFLEDNEVHDAYVEATKEADIWREDYPEYERLADNGLIDDLDETLPEVNDGSLAAALFKLPKRIVSSKLRGRARALDCDDLWKTELANIEWEKRIVPNANSQAPFHRKWKDAVRKAAIYGGQPVINLFVERGSYTGSDFIVPQATDVKLEAGKVSDYDSDIVFWDIFYSRTQLESMKEDAIEEMKEAATALESWKKRKAEDPNFDDDEPAPYNIWHLDVITDILTGQPVEERSGNEEAKSRQDKGVKQNGFHLYIAFQRGVNAPFEMRYGKKKVREWSNPDPTGDIPVHYVYCYQDFINPYGIGIVKLAGGTQNVLDYMRQADVLATQIGLRPPKLIEGNTDDVDFDSLTYTEDADWIVGAAKVTRMELADGVYAQLPNRVNMYKTSLNNILPMGDTSINAGAGDPNASKTPAGVRMAATNLSIDDEDFKDNFYMTYNAVAKSMINTHFANMQGNDSLKLESDEIEILRNAGIDFPLNELNEPTNELDIEWDKARATFDFEVDPSSGVITNDAEQLQQLEDALKLISPQVVYYLSQDGYKLNTGEAYHSLFAKMNLDNLDKIITQMTPQEADEAKKQPFPIIDPPQIRLTGQIPNGAMIPALQQGGVQVDPSSIMVQDNVDLGDIIKDPTTTAFEKAQIKKMAGIQPDPNPAQAPETPDTTKKPSESINYKDAPEDIKRQIEAQAGLKPSEMQSPVQTQLDQKTLDLKLKGNDQAHKQALAEQDHLQKADQQAHQQEQDKTQAQLPAAAPKPAQKTVKASLPAKKPAAAAPVAVPANQQPAQPTPEEQHNVNVEAVMEQHNIDQPTAEMMVKMEEQGVPVDEIMAGLERHKKRGAH